MTTCNAVHPQAEAMTAVGIQIEQCHLNVHAEGRHCFHAGDDQAESTQPCRVTVHEVVTKTPADWRFNVQKNVRYLTDGPRVQQSYVRSIRSLADIGDLLGVPVGIVVRTYTEGGGPDAA